MIKPATVQLFLLAEVQCSHLPPGAIMAAGCSTRTVQLSLAGHRLTVRRYNIGIGQLEHLDNLGPQLPHTKYEAPTSIEKDQAAGLGPEEYATRELHYLMH